jgi:aryl-alcohol dehydrogenase-like predicted oxidoreductase
VAAAPALAAFADRLEAAPAAVALAFALASESVGSVLFGATSAAQVRANCTAAGLLRRLTTEDLAGLRQIGASAAAS